MISFTIVNSDQHNFYFEFDAPIEIQHVNVYEQIYIIYNVFTTRPYHWNIKDSSEEIAWLQHMIS